MSALNVDNVSRHYVTSSGTVTALAEIHFSLAAGLSLAVTGPSGSGKSTLLGLIAGLDRPSQGSIHIAGTDLGSLNEDALARFRGRHIGFVFQNFRLLPGLTALENVSLPLDLLGDRTAAQQAQDWLTRVGLNDRANHLPSRLSGGEQQRVALARALITKPALVLADEPTGNLDSSTGTTMADLLFHNCAERKAALLIVTHDERMAERCDRRLALRDGRLVA
jgi:putative ABC transport system ATP-binding protein